jgi:hypothetical protein
MLSCMCTDELGISFSTATACPYYVIESNNRPQLIPDFDPFQYVVFKNFLDLIDDSSSLPFRQRCPCLRCWQYSVVCALLKHGDAVAFIRCARLADSRIWRVVPSAMAILYVSPFNGPFVMHPTLDAGGHPVRSG